MGKVGTLLLECEKMMEANPVLEIFPNILTGAFWDACFKNEGTAKGQRAGTQGLFKSHFTLSEAVPVHS